MDKPNHMRPLKARNFLWLVAEGKFREFGSLKVNEWEEVVLSTWRQLQNKDLRVASSTECGP